MNDLGCYDMGSFFKLTLQEGLKAILFSDFTSMLLNSIEFGNCLSALIKIFVTCLSVCLSIISLSFIDTVCEYCNCHLHK